MGGIPLLNCVLFTHPKTNVKLSQDNKITAKFKILNLSHFLLFRAYVYELTGPAHRLRTNSRESSSVELGLIAE